MTVEYAKQTVFWNISMYGFQPIQIYNEVETLLKTKEGRDFMALSFCLPAFGAIQMKDDSTLRSKFVGLSKERSAEYISARNAVDSICESKGIAIAGCSN